MSPFKAPDAFDKVKGAIKGIFSRKKKTKDQPTPSATTDAPASTAKPTETKPADPAPAAVPEPAKTDAAPATPATPAAPAPVDNKQPERAALAEVKKATTTPEPAGAAAPVPATATAAQEPPPPAATEPKPTDTKPTDPPVHEEPPAIPNTKPAPGMSATSGPMGDEPDFSAGNTEEFTPAPAAAATETPATEAISADKK